MADTTTESDDFTPQEKQGRFEATIRGALKTPPEPRIAKTKARQPGGQPDGSAEASDEK